MARKLNRGGEGVRKANINTEGMEFVNLITYSNNGTKKLDIDGFFFKTGNFGKECVVIADGKLINMPARAVEEFQQILDDSELTQALIDGKVYLENLSVFHDNKYNKDTPIYDLMVAD